MGKISTWTAKKKTQNNKKKLFKDKKIECLESWAKNMSPKV